MNSGQVSRDFNCTFIALIPKKKHVVKVEDFKPISLCNIIYKLALKVVANRLKVILPHIISVFQSAFVPGRQITDNILVVYDLVHYLRMKTKGKKEYMSIKLDMSKVYDRIEWTYLDMIMERLGFQLQFISLVMNCVSFTSFSILVNGTPTGHVLPTRGLRQRDSLSPYLFLLCTEGLVRLLENEVGGGKI